MFQVYILSFAIIKTASLHTVSGKHVRQLSFLFSEPLSSVSPTMGKKWIHETERQRTAYTMINSPWQQTQELQEPDRIKWQKSYRIILWPEYYYFLISKTLILKIALNIMVAKISKIHTAEICWLLFSVQTASNNQLELVPEILSVTAGDVASLQNTCIADRKPGVEA